MNELDDGTPLNVELSSLSLQGILEHVREDLVNVECVVGLNTHVNVGHVDGVDDFVDGEALVESSRDQRRANSTASDVGTIDTGYRLPITSKTAHFNISADKMLATPSNLTIWAGLDVFTVGHLFSLSYFSVCAWDSICSIE